MEQVTVEALRRGDIICEQDCGINTICRVLSIHRIEPETEFGLTVNPGEWQIGVEMPDGERKTFTQALHPGAHGLNLYRLRSEEHRSQQLLYFTPGDSTKYQVGWFPVQGDINHRLFVFGTHERLMSSVWDTSYRGLLYWDAVDKRIGGAASPAKHLEYSTLAAAHVLSWLLGRKLYGATYDITANWVSNWHQQLIDLKW